MSTKPSIFVGGKLKLKSTSKAGVSASSDEQSIESKNSVRSDLFIKTNQINEHNEKVTIDQNEFLTPAQIRHREKKRKLEEREIKKMAKIPFRERIEIFNNKLATLTEHNDIPRVSAAGNG